MVRSTQAPDDAVPNDGAASAPASPPPTPGPRPDGATCRSRVNDAAEIDAVLDEVRVVASGVETEAIASRLDRIAARALHGVCTDVASSWCGANGLQCEVLVRDGLLLSEPSDDLDVRRIRLVEVEGAVTDAAIDYQDLPAVATAHTVPSAVVRTTWRLVSFEVDGEPVGVDRAWSMHLDGDGSIAVWTGCNELVGEVGGEITATEVSCDAASAQIEQQMIEALGAEPTTEGTRLAFDTGRIRLVVDSAGQ